MRLVIAFLALIGTAQAQVSQGVTVYNGNTSLGLVGKLKFSSGICSKTSTGVVTCTVVGGSFVNLQATTPGTAQTGNINITGKILTGNGTAASPAWGFASDSGAGCNLETADTILCSYDGGTHFFQYGGNAFRIAGDLLFNGTLYGSGGAAPIIGGFGGAGIFQSADAGNQGTTVGGVGGADALPALPAGYFIAKTADGTLVRVPYYLHP